MPDNAGGPGISMPVSLSRVRVAVLRVLRVDYAPMMCVTLFTHVATTLAAMVGVIAVDLGSGTEVAVPSGMCCTIWAVTVLLVVLRPASDAGAVVDMFSVMSAECTGVVIRMVTVL